jgi:hypothetical protein
MGAAQGKKKTMKDQRKHHFIIGNTITDRSITDSAEGMVQDTKQLGEEQSFRFPR